MDFQGPDKFLVVGTEKEGKAQRSRVVVESGQVLQDFLAEDFPALFRNVEDHALGAVSIAFGTADDTFVLLERREAVINGGRAEVRPAVELAVTDFRDDVVAAAFMLQNEA